MELNDPTYDPKMRAGGPDLFNGYAERGYWVLYVTARPSTVTLAGTGETTEQATRRWLTDHGFPLGDRTRLTLAPQFLTGEPVRMYKAGALQDLAAEGFTFDEAYGNAVKLQQVFTSLLLNARDAIPDGGRITVATSTADDGSLVVEVADTGIGIAPENVAKIYDPFYTTKGVGQGTGLGLAVTYGIVQEHAGHISVDSLPGRGTTFRITLPTTRVRARLQAVGD